MKNDEVTIKVIENKIANKQKQVDKLNVEIKTLNDLLEELKYGGPKESIF